MAVELEELLLLGEEGGEDDGEDDGEPEDDDGGDGDGILGVGIDAEELLDWVAQPPNRATTPIRISKPEQRDKLCIFRFSCDMSRARFGPPLYLTSIARH